MARGLRFALVLVACLGLLAWLALLAVNETTRRWFEKDVTLRADLAVSGSRRALVSYWRGGDWRELRTLLLEVTHDERIMGAAACTADLKLVARTPEYPDRFRCPDIAPRVRPSAGVAPEAWQTWRSVAELPGGKVHLSAIPIVDGGAPLGFVVLVHDMSFMERREETLRDFLLTAFVVLALCASVVTVVAARLSWRSWSNEVRRFLRAGGQKPEFLPVMRDVRELVERLAHEREAETGAGWTPQRLKHALERHLQGERVIAVANREPYIHERRDRKSVV